MAIAKSFINLKGTIYNTTFRRGIGSKVIAGQKSSLDAAQVKTSAAFANTRLNNAEFATSAHAGDLFRGIAALRRAFHESRLLIPHLVRMGIAVLRQDVTNPWGLRTVANGIAVGPINYNKMDYNEDAPLPSVIQCPFTVTVDRVAGTATTNIPSFVPNAFLVPPAGLPYSALKFQLFVFTGEMDFDNGFAIEDGQITAVLPWDGAGTAIINFIDTFTAASVLPVVTSLGINWWLTVSGVDTLLRNKSNNAMRIVNVDTV